MNQRTLLIVKPDGVSRGLVGEVIRRVEQKGLHVVRLRMIYPRRECMEKLYDIHKGKGCLLYTSPSPRD
jgi:nucleoside-diphosphate kinase